MVDPFQTVAFALQLNVILRHDVGTIEDNSALVSSRTGG